MSKITKLIAESIADKLLETADSKIDSIKKSIDDYVSGKIFGRTPAKIIECFNDKALRRFICTSSYIGIAGPGLHYSLNLKQELPYSGDRLVLNENEARELELMTRIKKDLIDERRKVFDEIVLTLMKLSTFNRVREQFPEAGELLPNVNTKIALNIDNVRNNLNSLVK